MSKLAIGDHAPAFQAKDQHGNSISLQEFSGKKLVLYFYPKDDTPGCTAEACNLRDNYEHFQAKGYEIIGVSADSEKSHQKFIDKYSLPFRLIADVDKAVSEAFGVYGLKKFMGKEYMGINRTTFVIDEKGIIEKVIEKVETKNHSAQLI